MRLKQALRICSAYFYDKKYIMPRPVVDAAERRIAIWYRRHVDVLRERVEVARQVHFWGYDYTVIPRLVDKPLGDGLRLMSLTPLNTRPDYYVFRGDSRHETDSEWFYDNLEALYDTVEDQFGSSDRQQDCEVCNGYTCEQCQADREWPALNLDAGCCWGELWWPHPFIAERESD